MKSKIFKMMLMLVLSFIAVSCKSKGQSTDEESSESERPKLKQGKRDPERVKQLFEKMDKNEDGLLTKDEVKGPLSNNFDKIDINNDGHITTEELENTPKPRRKGPPKRN